MSFFSFCRGQVSSMALGQSTFVQTDMSEQLLDEFPLHFLQTFLVPKDEPTLVATLYFPVAPS